MTMFEIGKGYEFWRLSGGKVHIVFSLEVSSIRRYLCGTNFVAADAPLWFNRADHHGVCGNCRNVYISHMRKKG